MKYAFSKRFCWKTISVVHAIQDLTDLVENFWLKVTTGMIWSISSDKRKASSDSDTIIDFFPFIFRTIGVSFFKLSNKSVIAVS